MAKIQTTERRGNVPAYVQVASALRRRIENGEWKPQQQISTLEELEREFQVARVTVRQAIGLLEDEGLVTRRQGRGTFVREAISGRRWLQLESSWESIVMSIKDNVPSFVDVAHPPPFPRLDEGEARLAPEYVFLRSVQTRDGMPYAVVSLHLSRDIFERQRGEFLRKTALPVLADMDDVRIGLAHQTIVIGTADRETADLLQVPLSAPTAECRWLVTDEHGVAIYVADITYRSECIKLSIDLLEAGRSAARDNGGAARAR
ncbi:MULTISPECIES: GntR family transcriptional regulator [Burkholderia]|uniref:GntR family transcriptional regulator n=1 Tax=Burkholderia TaxID=32008 RepID=UPI000BF81BDD|nr:MULTISPECIES: GntR family transcriptional regulator [Burkholderia]PFH20465.1 GntR family transcriptional regulator [Burkholderia sp. JKS000303]